MSTFKWWGVLAADGLVARGRHRPCNAKRTSHALCSPVRGPAADWSETPSLQHGRFTLFTIFISPPEEVRNSSCRPGATHIRRAGPRSAE